MHIKIVAVPNQAPVFNEEEERYTNLELHRDYHVLSDYFRDDFEIDPEETKYLASRGAGDGLVLVKNGRKYVAYFGDGGTLKIEKTIEQVNHDYHLMVERHNQQAREEHANFMNFIQNFKG